MSGLVILAALQSVVALDSSLRLTSIGARGGFGANTEAQPLHQAEAFATWDLPWRWDFNADVFVQTELESAAGWLGGNGEDAFTGECGIGLVLGFNNLPLTLEAGSNPTILSRHTFGSVNVGTEFQFTTHIGLNWDVCPHFRAGYRFEHISNAGISRPNPGLNMHLFGVSYLF